MWESFVFEYESADGKVVVDPPEQAATVISCRPVDLKAQLTHGESVLYGDVRIPSGGFLSSKDEWKQSATGAVLIDHPP